MKINYTLLFALLCSCFIACSEDINENETNDYGSGSASNGEISLSIDCDQQVSTKGSLVTEANTLSSIGVYSFNSSTGATVHENIEANYNGFRTAQYWPSYDIDFVAYTPYIGEDEIVNGLEINSISSESFVFNYTVPTSIADQPDFMISTPLLNQSETTNTIQLSLQHAMASVGFRVQGDDPRGVIDAITVYNIVDNGVVTMDVATGDISWVAGTTTTDYSPTMNTSVVTTQDYSQLAVNSDQYLLMVPQNVDNATYDVTSTISTDYEYPQYITEQFTYSGVPFSGTWDVGEVHVYNTLLEDNLPFVVIDDNTTQAEIAAKIAKMVAWGYDDIIIVGGYGDDYFDNPLDIVSYEALLGYALEYALEYPNNSFNSIDLSEVVMLGDTESTNHLSNDTFGDNLTDAQKAMITSVTLPADLAKLYSYTFLNYTNLEEVIFTDGCTTIDIAVNTFEGCTSLTKFIGSSSIQSILAYGFLNCTSLETVYIPGEGVLLGKEAFMGCTSLTELWIATEGAIGAIITTAFNEFNNIANCTLYTNYANVSSGSSSGSYVGGDGGQITISDNTVTITETNVGSTNSSSQSYTFADIVLLEYADGVYYKVNSNGVKTGTTYNIPTQN